MTTKTYEEMMAHFDKEYPNQKLLENPIFIGEAIGFLSAVSLMYPEYENNCAVKIALMMAIGTLSFGG